MSLGARTREEVTARLRRLRRDYGWFSVRDERVENDPEYFECARRKAEDGWVGDACVVVSDHHDRVLVIRHAEAPERWGIPGGGHDPVEKLSGTARREVREETGIACRLTDVREATRREIYHEDDPDRRLFVLRVVFSGVRVGGECALGDDEVVEARWVAEPPDSMVAFVAPHVESWFEGRS